MYLAQIPFYPANRATYDYDTIKPKAESIHVLYPELFRCVACNACTKVCPMDVEVMDYISELKRGDIEAAAHTSFDCIQCGLCASRCMGELPQYHIAQLARRLWGGKLAPTAQHMLDAVDKINSGYFDEMLEELKAMSEEELRELYTARENEPVMADESWRPAEKTGL